MAEIRHRIGIRGSAADIYQLLTTNSGLSKWWTTDTRGAGPVGSTIAFRFGGGGPDFTVTELVPNRLVRWQHCGNIPEEWQSSEVLFELKEDGKQTIVNFSHRNWTKSSEFLAHCSTKWGVFMMSIKSCIETGSGQPYPDDVHIDFDD